MINGISLTQKNRRHELEYSTLLIKHSSLACVVKSSSPIAAKPNLSPAISLSTPPKKWRVRDSTGAKGKCKKVFFVHCPTLLSFFLFFSASSASAKVKDEEGGGGQKFPPSFLSLAEYTVCTQIEEESRRVKKR